MPSSILYGVCDVLERSGIYTEHYTIKTFTTTTYKVRPKMEKQCNL